MLSYEFLSHMSATTLIAMAQDLIGSLGERTRTRDEQDSWTRIVDECSDLIGREETMARLARFDDL